jgi:hypothetical protein
MSCAVTKLPILSTLIIDCDNSQKYPCAGGGACKAVTAKDCSAFQHLRTQLIATPAYCKCLGFQASISSWAYKGGHQDMCSIGDSVTISLPTIIPNTSKIQGGSCVSMHSVAILQICALAIALCSRMVHVGRPVLPQAETCTFRPYTRLQHWLTLDCSDWKGCGRL